MSYQTVINQILIEDQQLKGLLAASVIDDTLPAIYEASNVPHDAPMPYVAIRYQAAASTEHLYKRQGETNLDIYANDGDTIRVEAIARRINRILIKQRRIISGLDGKISIYKSNAAAGNIPEDEPGIIHWNEAFEIQWWEKSLID